MIYINGNYIVKISKDGTKVYTALRNGEDFNPEFPDSIDLKITGRCDIGCKYCHESSTPGGKELDVDRTKKMLDELPDYPIEIAIGGGDILTCPDKLKDLVLWLKHKKCATVAGTINLKSLMKSYGTHLQDEQEELLREFDSIGISIDKVPTLEEQNYIARMTSVATVIVYHVILGIISPEDLSTLLTNAGPYSSRILVLGYKSFGRGLTFGNPLTPELIERYRKIVLSEEVRNSLKWLKNNTKGLVKPTISPQWSGCIGFDNLAIQQLSLKDLIPEQLWEILYLGDEFTNTMYVDAVEETFAPTSRSNNRVSWNDMGLLQYFNTYRNK